MERSGKHSSSYLPKELVSNVSCWQRENWFSLIMLFLLIVLHSRARSHILEYMGKQHKLELMHGEKKTHIWEDKESWVSVREVGREKVSIMKT